MIIYMDGTVFNAPVKTFVNTVNCAGVMGAGIALEFKLRYPEMFIEYVKQCKEGTMKVGIPSIFKYSDDVWIMNFPTKGHWRYPSKMKWLEDGLRYFVNNYERLNVKSIAFPKLGTSNGGLDWNEVKPLMEKYLKGINIPVYICLDEKKESEGIEKIMVDKLNLFSVEQLQKEIKIPTKQAKLISDNMPFQRFWHVSKIDGLGKSTYQKLFSYLYKKSKDTDNIFNEKAEQVSMFEDMGI